MNCDQARSDAYDEILDAANELKKDIIACANKHNLNLITEVYEIIAEANKEIYLNLEQNEKE